MRRYFAVLDAHLQQQDFIVAGKLSLADFAVGVTLPYAEASRIPLNDYPAVRRWPDRLCALPGWLDPFRSEEHTSELQSLMRISYAVFCLKKKHATQLQY